MRLMKSMRLLLCHFQACVLLLVFNCRFLVETQAEEAPEAEAAEEPVGGSDYAGPHMGF